MVIPAEPENELERLEELKSFQILDSLPEQAYDDITNLASEICGTPISLITLIDKNRQWFKSNHGLSIRETPRHEAFCAHGILDHSAPLIVENAHEDLRFKDNPLVTGDPNIDFYAGIPLVTKDGYALGSLCVIDSVPHKLTPDKIVALKILARQVVKLLELHKKINELNVTQKQLQQTVENLKELSNIVAHDIKSPIRNMRMFAELIIEDYGEKLDEDVKEHVHHIINCARKSQQYINGILEYSRTVYFLNNVKEKVFLNHLIADIAYQLTPPEGVEISYQDDLPVINTYKTALQIILTNIVGNAVKYNNKETDGYVNIHVEIEDDKAFFTISDNGQGIPVDKLSKIFALFYIGQPEDAKENDSTGIGLSIVKKIVSQLGGEITVSSTVNEGSEFKFWINL